MSGCGCNNDSGGAGGPFSKGKELVEFVYNAHGGTVRDQPIAQGALDIVCQGCKAPFTLKTYVGKCPGCGGVHAVAPMNPVAENVQFAGIDSPFLGRIKGRLPESCHQFNRFAKTKG